MSLQSETGEKELDSNHSEKLENLTEEAQIPVHAARRRFYEMLKSIFKRSDVFMSESMEDTNTFSQELSTKNCDPRKLFPETFFTSNELNHRDSLCNLYDMCNAFNEECEILKLDGNRSADNSDIKSPKGLACMKISTQELLSVSSKEANNVVKCQKNTKLSQTNYSLKEMESDIGYRQQNLVTDTSKKSNQIISLTSTKRPDAQNNKDMTPSSLKVNKTKELKSDSGECCSLHKTDVDIFNRIDSITVDNICLRNKNEEERLKDNSDNRNQECIKRLPEIFYWAKTLRRDTDRLNHDIHSNFDEDIKDYEFDDEEGSDEYWEYELDNDDDLIFEECCTSVWETFFDAPQEQISDLDTMLNESFENALALIQPAKKISCSLLKSVDSKHVRGGSGRMNQSTARARLKMPERQPSRSGNRGDRKDFKSPAKKPGDLKNVKHETVKFQQKLQKKMKRHSSPMDNSSTTSITRNLKKMRGERRPKGASPYTSPDRQKSKSALKGSMIAKAKGASPYTSPDRQKSKSALKGSMIAKAKGSSPYNSPDRQQSKSSMKGSMISKIFKPSRNAQSPTNLKQPRSTRSRSRSRSKVSNAKPLSPANQQRMVSKESSKSKSAAPRGKSTVSTNKSPRSTPTTPPSRGKERKDQPQRHTARPHQRPKSEGKCSARVQHGKSPRSRDQERSRKTGRFAGADKRK